MTGERLPVDVADVDEVHGRPAVARGEPECLLACCELTEHDVRPLHEAGELGASRARDNVDTVEGRALPLFDDNSGVMAATNELGERRMERHLGSPAVFRHIGRRDGEEVEPCRLVEAWVLPPNEQAALQGAHTQFQLSHSARHPGTVEQRASFHAPQSGR